MFQNPDMDAIAQLLRTVKTIAVVGLSPNPDRPSHRVARGLQRAGYRIVPVRPATDTVLGEKAYARVTDITFQVDLVDVFRAPAEVDAIVTDALAAGVPRLWLQDGVINEAAALRAQQGGMQVIMDRCIWRDWVQLMT